MNMDILYKIVVAIGIFGSLGVTIWTHFSSKNRNKEDEKVKQEKKQEAFNSAQEAFNSVSKEKLEKIEGQVNNHLPTQIKEVKKRIKGRY